MDILDLVLDLDESLTTVTLALKKASLMLDDLMQEYFAFDADKSSAFILYEHENAAFHNDIALDYLVEAKKEVFAMQTMVNKMYEECKQAR